MFSKIRDWRRGRILERARVSDAAWREVVERAPFLGLLDDEDAARLRECMVLFLAGKQVHGAAGYEVDDGMRLLIAAQGCLPILNLDVGLYDEWVEVIVYPSEFAAEREHVDDAGVVHRWREPLAGESWLQGPLVLSAADLEPYDEPWPVNVVIHEFAHKLDMLNGDADGLPPLHPGMSGRQWEAAFRTAYDDLCARADEEDECALDPYAAESPGEFFAVASEAFFQAPLELRDAYPEVYAQLSLYYRQDPALRFQELP